MEQQMTLKLKLGDSLEVLKKCPDNYVDSIVTDPPYGLSFMGKKWDYAVPSAELWKECLRVLKPGGHLLAFGGTRTYHRLVVAIEDAGFEIRDQIQWIYSQGFPKSQDISKAIDKAFGVEREIIGSKFGLPGYSMKQAEESEVYGDGLMNGPKKCEITRPATPEAQKWSGWGSTLKPANEPICLARKALSESTLAKNVLKHGTGGLNIDVSRIETEETLTSGRHRTTGTQTGPSGFTATNRSEYEQNTAGRFPANVIFDEDAAKVLDGQTGERPGPWGKDSKGNAKGEGSMFGIGGVNSQNELRGKETGGASRFFKIIEKDITCDQNDLSTAALVGSSFKHAGKSESVRLPKGALDGTSLPRCSNCEKPIFSEGLGSTLKPANEPICLARKPLSESTIAKNVLKHGTGGLNIDVSRIEAGDLEDLQKNWNRVQSMANGTDVMKNGLKAISLSDRAPTGRFPANVILDEDAAKVLDGQTGILKSGARKGTEKAGFKTQYVGGEAKGFSDTCVASEGGGSRFFYIAKASKSDRGEGNTHPTVKPVKLMEYLIKLITPTGGIVLDPFMGSGTTGVAAQRLGFGFVGVELLPEYFEIAKQRIEGVKNGAE